MRFGFEMEQENLRTIEQNKQQWPYLQAFANQKQWPVNGNLTYMTRESWKHVLTAGFIKYMTSVGGIEAELVRRYLTQNIAIGFSLNEPNHYDIYGTVMMGYHTRQFTEEIWPYWMEFLRTAAAECEIKVPLSKKQQAMYEDLK